MYTMHVFMDIGDLVHFLNTSNAGGPVLQAKIVTVQRDASNGSLYVVLAP